MYLSDYQSSYDRVSDVGVTIVSSSDSKNGTIEPIMYPPRQLSSKACFLLLTWGLLILFWTIFIIINSFGKEDRVTILFRKLFSLRTVRVCASKRVTLRLRSIKNVHIDQADLAPINFVSTNPSSTNIDGNEIEKAQGQVIEDEPTHTSSFQNTSCPYEEVIHIRHADFQG
ncbi:hypothetical protein CROQUDRAFT_657268 [Cronartium quercuum f. sp. fusiforme G11]|uniref:Uncharacterized protein n=1 Tax=Cronartium quercuum f. sp. fusiforme G11 TaxID=708437 RepID=A0A9P6NLS0_9BASI|nr:hypothetical protein CROQUDRAFT_657268 [Cronartium quercuum f. sp. fusiforme G11]